MMRASSVLAKSTARHGFDDETASNVMACEVLAGLTADHKFLPSKYFYDARGSKLFEMICNLPEYYPTRTELSVLSTHAKDIVRGLGSSDLVELGWTPWGQVGGRMYAMFPSTCVALHWKSLQLN
jgi:uncharacterized SAM-dependent methyltransferase